MSTYANILTEQLVSLAGKVPDSVDVLQLAQPNVGTVQRRVTALTSTVAELTGLDANKAEVTNDKDRTLVELPGQLRAVGFHASGALSVQLALGPFDDVFKDDPGDTELTAMLGQAADRLGLGRLLPADDTLDFERLWRIKAAGGDQSGTLSPPVLCRAVGAFRHATHGIPVYGRASATVELAQGGRLASLSVSARRSAEDGSGKTVATPEVRRPEAAAKDVAARVVKALGGLEDLKGTHVVPEWFRFGYLSLGRRRTQAALAPFYLASISLKDTEAEASAHVIAVPGTEEQFVALPTGQRSSDRSPRARIA